MKHALRSLRFAARLALALCVALPAGITPSSAAGGGGGGHGGGMGGGGRGGGFGGGRGGLGGARAGAGLFHIHGRGGLRAGPATPDAGSTRIAEPSAGARGLVAGQGTAAAAGGLRGTGNLRGGRAISRRSRRVLRRTLARSRLRQTNRCDPSLSERYGYPHTCDGANPYRPYP